MQKYGSKLKNLFRQKRLLFISSITLFISFTILFIPLHTWISAQQEAQSLEVSPPSQETTVNPGDTITITSKVRNDTTAPLTMNVHIEDFTAAGDQGQVALTTGGNYSVTSWAKVTPTVFTLNGGQEQQVTATITVPKNAAGGRYGSFVFGVTPSKVAGKNAAALSQAIASLFLLRINGKTNEMMSITSFQSPTFSEFGPIPFTMTFKNTGNVHLKTYGLINVTDMFGQKQADIVINGTNVFPGATRIIDAKLNKTWLIGSYTATAIMYYGYTQNQTLTQTTTFFVFPVRIACALLIVLFILFFARKRFGKAVKALMGK